MRSPKRPNSHQVSCLQAVTTPGECPRKVTIGVLSDEVLLNIFRYYVDSSPRFWPKLVQICRKWRQIVLTSQRALHLRLFCTHGTSVLKALDRWPSLPIVVEYEGLPALDPPTAKDRDDIIKVALRHPNHVISISLTVSGLLLEKFFAIEMPFYELEDLVLMSQESLGLTFPGTFRWGRRLRTLRLTGVSIPALPELLSLSTGLIDLQLHDIPNDGYFSPEAFVNVLSGMTQLRTCSLKFHSFTPRRNDLGFPSHSGELTVLPDLMYLGYRGPSKYLDTVMASIDAPRLADINITFFSQSMMDVSQLGRFINQIETKKSHCQADIVSSERTISISFSQPEALSHLELQVDCGRCEPIAWQLSCMAQICNSLSAFLVGVEQLCISVTQPSSWEDCRDLKQWGMLICPFRRTKWVHVTGEHSTKIVLALSLWPHEPMLPNLLKLCIREPESCRTPLREAVLIPFIHSRRLSGHIIAVEYERVRPHEIGGKGPFFQKVTMDILPDDVLLKIFRLYLHSYPQFWPTLTHVSRRWRNIVVTSPLPVRPRVYCTYGIPVSRILDCWRAFPIVEQYEGAVFSPLAPEDEDNRVTALRHSDRISSIDLAITDPLLENLFAIDMPFSELEELVLRSEDNVQTVPVQLTLRSTLRWGTRLLSKPHSTRVSFPTVPGLLSPSTGLVDLQLHEIPVVGYFSPKAFADALSKMTQLETLSLHFLSFPHRRNHLGLPPRSGERAVLPALTRLKFQGTSKYLNSFVARIDAPRLGDIDITFFCRPTLDASQLDQFINRTEMQKSHRRAEILSSERTVNISFTQPEAPTRLDLQVSCKPLAKQLSYMVQICNSLSTVLLGVEHLRISTTQSSSGHNNSDRYEWLELMHPFRGTKWVHLAGDHSTSIMLALRFARGFETWHDSQHVLPALQKLCIRELEAGNAPLREAVGSFMQSRRLSGRVIGVVYERVWTNGLRGTAPFAQQVTIEILPDDVLLNIFRLHLYSSPQYWPTFTHVSRRWRNIVFTSPLGLDLRLYCTYGTPVSKTLDCWPALPIVLQYGGHTTPNLLALEDEVNIVAAMKHSDRLRSIDLTITTSLLKKLSVIEVPCSELEELVLRSEDNVRLTLLSTFRWGVRLRKLHSTRVAFPALPGLLSPSTSLVDLQLHEIPSAGYFSPEVFANVLSDMTELETLSLHFLSFPPRRKLLVLPPQSGERVALPALTSLTYRGTSKYLDSFVARIDAPRLGDIDITFYNQPTMDVMQLGRFMERIEMQTSLSQAEVRFSEPGISISFTQPSAPTRLELRVSCLQLDWQLSSIAQICDLLSPFTFRVEGLSIRANQLVLTRQGGINREQWLKLIHSFRGVKEFYVDEKLVTDILIDLNLAYGEGSIFPSWRTLRVWELGRKPFTALRLLEKHYVPVYGQGSSCTICRASFTDQQELKKHLVVMHAYRLVCPYCGDFEFAPRYSDLFREHLTSTHPGIAHNDTLILNPSSQTYSPSYSGGQVTQTNDLRATVNFGVFTMFKAPNVQTQLGAVLHFFPSPFPTWFDKYIK